MLVKSLEQMKASGLVSYLHRQANIVEMKLLISLFAMETPKQNGSYKDDAIVRGRNLRFGLSESVIMESFVALMYGLALSVLVLAFELVLNRMCEGILAISFWRSSVRRKFRPIHKIIQPTPVHHR